MRRFNKNILLFTIPVILIFVLSFFFLNRFIKVNFEKYRLSPGIDKIVIGDSHIQTAIIDSIIDGMKNISQSSESYIFSLYKIKTLIRNNPDVDTIFLGASYHNFSDYFDGYTYNHTVMSLYFYILPFEQQFELIKGVTNPAGFFLKSYLYWSGLLLNRAEADKIWGGYFEHVTDLSLDESFIDRRIREQYFIKEQSRDFSANNIRYFYLVAEYCRSNNISLIILNTPLHRTYKEKVPDKFVNKFYSIINDNHLDIIEFDDLVLADEDFLPDGDHLKEKGALSASRYLSEYLRKKHTVNSPNNGLLTQ